MTYLLAFEVADQRYGFAGRHVREVLRAVGMASLANVPGVVEGVIDLRGTIVPVLSLRHALGLPRRSLSPSDHLIITALDGRLLALRADRAVDWLSIPDSALETVTGVDAGLPLAGVARLPDGLIVIHDPRRFLSEAELARIDRAIAGEGDE